MSSLGRWMALSARSAVLAPAQQHGEAEARRRTCRGVVSAVVREGDQRGRHTTTASELVRLPGNGWLIDTPGVRAVSLWSSGRGIERAFADVFELMDHCRFRDCKHEQEPECAVSAAIEAGALDPKRLESMKRLVAEEAVLEEEQRAQEKAQDRRGVRKVRPKP